MNNNHAFFSVIAKAATPNEGLCSRIIPGRLPGQEAPSSGARLAWEPGRRAQREPAGGLPTHPPWATKQGPQQPPVVGMQPLQPLPECSFPQTDRGWIQDNLMPQLAVGAWRAPPSSGPGLSQVLIGGEQRAAGWVCHSPHTDPPTDGV